MKVTDLQTQLDRIHETYLACWTLAGPTMQAAGKDWYPYAHTIADKMVGDYGLPTIWHAAGLIAALSPQMAWDVNIAAAWDVLKRDHNARRPQGSKWQTDANMGKALRCLTCDTAEDVISLFHNPSKTHSFIFNIAVPQFPLVTLDAWALRVVGLPEVLKERQYSLVESAVISAADRLKVEPSTLQATVWLYARDALALQPGEYVALDGTGAHIAGTGTRGLDRSGARLYQLA